MNKAIKSLPFLPLLFLSLHASSISVSHTYTYWAGQGQCSAHFVLDSEFQPIKQLTFNIWSVEKNKRIHKHEVSVSDFGESSINRYLEFYIEGEDVCDSEGDIKFLITNTKIIDTDNELVRSAVQASNFTPNKIIIGK